MLLGDVSLRSERSQYEIQLRIQLTPSASKSDGLYFIKSKFLSQNETYFKKSPCQAMWKMVQ
jgi:hypothetical protein